MKPDDLWPSRVTIKVPWRDIDAAGHVNNAVYFSYFETARVEAFLRMVGGDSPRDLGVILARATCDYLAPARMGDVLDVSTWPTRVGESSFVLAYEAREQGGDRVFARGDSVQVLFDYATNRKRRIPDEIRSLLAWEAPEATG